ncbi:FecR domain-containing protein [Rahnella aceris]|jgi:transmembrane sensor|uniref:FecR domain-containing protein n=1 Tax=Rahnella sp. (strain Y9602) TaxID=2703885 RepID=A0ABW6CFZ0_RAHSY
MSNKPGFAALQQAANWYAEVQDISSPQTYPAALQRWLDESQENQLAWQYVLNISQRFSPLRENGERQAAAFTALTQRTHNAGRRQVLKMAAWISVGTLLAWGSWPHTPLRNLVLAWHADYHTPHGEITSFTLADGSRIWLDTDSALNVDYSPTQRALQLLNGRMMIETAADPHRPLTIVTAQGKMRALGTRFSVQALGDTSVLQVYQGAVEVSPAAISDASIVQAGQAMAFRRDGFGPVSSLRNTEPAWPRGLLQADNLPLGEFIKRLSAYRRGYLGCDPAVSALTVTGTFPLHDTDMALDMLTNALPVQLNRRFSWWLTVAPRDK